MGIKKPAHKRWAGFIHLLTAIFIISVLKQMINNRYLLRWIVFFIDDLTGHMHDKLAQPAMGWMMLQ